MSTHHAGVLKIVEMVDRFAVFNKEEEPNASQKMLSSQVNGIRDT
jgi:hypothetical protein